LSLGWWNGRTVPPEEIRIAADDSGFLFGEGLFETLRVDAGRARDVEAHLDRLLAGLRRVGIALPDSRPTLEKALEEIAAAAPRPTARMRLTVTRSTRLITATPYEPPALVTAALLPRYRIDSASPLAGLKSLSYQANRLALRDAEAQGAWDALLVNERGRLVSGSRSNLAVVVGGRVVTPPEGDGCLPGTVRRRLLESGAIEERSLAPEDLRGCEVLLMNSLIGVLPVSRIDGRESPVGITARALQRVEGHEDHRPDRPRETRP
jgi:branched-chain amino acid aminotransferase